MTLLLTALAHVLSAFDFSIFARYNNAQAFDNSTNNVIAYWKNNSQASMPSHEEKGSNALPSSSNILLTHVSHTAPSRVVSVHDVQHRQGADCGVRCYAERKAYCRDLHRWGRNLLYMIGLETVAQQVADRRSWKHISPFLDKVNSDKPTTSSEEEVVPKDWEPNGTCPICSERRLGAPTPQAAVTPSSKCDDESKLSKASTPRPVEQESNKKSRLATNSAVTEGVTLNFDNIFNINTNYGYDLAAMSSSVSMAPFMFVSLREEKTTKQTTGALDAVTSQSIQVYCQQMMQWTALLQMMAHMPPTQQQIFMQMLTQPANLNTGTSASKTDSCDKPQKSTTSKSKAHTKTQSTSSCSKLAPPSTHAQLHSNTCVEKPLDLSTKTSSSALIETNAKEEKSSTTTDTVDIISAKRNYTQEDLDRAVMEIRAGKLGTRRASVVYGIPRSTLRNKIYKLEASETGRPPPKRHKRTKECVVKEHNHTVTNNGKNASPTLDADSEDVADDDSVADGLDAGEESSDSYESASESMGEKRVSTQNVNNIAVSAPAPTSTHGSECNSTRGSSTPESRGTTNGRASNGSNKGSRPKRGQYRKYDKNALEQAVQAVRSGEMSVHRAGSLYGVPHSTLEYKVKEKTDDGGVKTKQQKVPPSQAQSPSESMPAPQTNNVEAVDSFWQQFPAFFAGLQSAVKQKQ